MTIMPVNYEEWADTLEKSLDMFGVKNAFEFFGISRKEWMHNMQHEVGKKEEWNEIADNNDKIRNLLAEEKNYEKRYCILREKNKRNGN